MVNSIKSSDREDDDSEAVFSSRARDSIEVLEQNENQDNTEADGVSAEDSPLESDNSIENGDQEDDDSSDSQAAFSTARIARDSMSQEIPWR
jgi:hypothetical protein